MSDASQQLAAAATAAVSCDPGEKIKLVAAALNGTDAVTGTTFPTESQMPALDFGEEVPSEFAAKVAAAKAAVADMYAAMLALGE